MGRRRNGGGGSTGGKEGRNALQRHTDPQRKLLEAAFARESQPNEQQKKAIAEQTGLSARQVRNWFQNRRQRLKGRALNRQATSLADINEDLVARVQRHQRTNSELDTENRLLRCQARKARAHLEDLQDIVEHHLLPGYYDAKARAQAKKARGVCPKGVSPKSASPKGVLAKQREKKEKKKKTVAFPQHTGGEDSGAGGEGGAEGGASTACRKRPCASAPPRKGPASKKSRKGRR